MEPSETSRSTPAAPPQGSSSSPGYPEGTGGILLLAAMILGVGLCAGWMDLPWVRDGGTAGPQGSSIWVEVRGSSDLEGFYGVSAGTTLGSFLRTIGARPTVRSGRSPLEDRVLEDMTAVVLAGGSGGGTIPEVVSISPGTAFLLGAPLDLNRAGARDLALLPGVGPTLALRIVEDRRARGPLGSPEELVRVRGFPRKTVEAIKPLVKAERE